MNASGDSIANGCMIPLGQALATGALCGGAVVGLALWLKWADPWAMGLIAAGGGAVLWWVSSILMWREAVYADLRPVIPPVVAPQEVAVETVRVDFREEGRMAFPELPASAGQMKDLAIGLLAGAPFSEATWCGEGRPFSRGQFQAVREEFRRQGWARWRNERATNQGMEISPAGRAVCRELVGGNGR